MLTAVEKIRHNGRRGRSNDKKTQGALLPLQKQKHGFIHHQNL